MKKLTGTFCGEFYTDAKASQYVGQVWKLAANRYVIRSQQNGKIEWESAEFSGKVFRKIGVFDAGYARVNQYTAA